MNPSRPFVEAMLLLGETFNESISEMRIEAYWAALSDLPADVALKGMRLAMGTSQFFPKPVDIRNAALGSTADRAEDAWAAMTQAVRRVGYLGYPKFDDPAVMDTIKALWGSWSRLCETLPADGPELVGWRKSFLAAYGTSDRRLATAATLEQLQPGLAGALRELAAAKEMPGRGMRIVRQASDDPTD
jgi:hypothetical protein